MYYQFLKNYSRRKMARNSGIEGKHSHQRVAGCGERLKNYQSFAFEVECGHCRWTTQRYEELIHGLSHIKGLRGEKGRTGRERCVTCKRSIHLIYSINERNAVNFRAVGCRFRTIRSEAAIFAAHKLVTLCNAQVQFFLKHYNVRLFLPIVKRIL